MLLVVLIFANLAEAHASATLPNTVSYHFHFHFSVSVSLPLSVSLSVPLSVSLHLSIYLSLSSHRWFYFAHAFNHPPSPNPHTAKRCYHFPPNPASQCEGTNGYEVIDAQWMVAAGADYIKEDSCCGSQDHATAFSDYGKMRDALNATGRPVFFSLCGWNDWYAPPDPSVGYKGGYSMGNSWRIHGDGSGWDALSGCTNTMAYLTQYTGPGGWNDPDLLIGPEVCELVIVCVCMCSCVLVFCVLYVCLCLCACVNELSFLCV